MADIYGKRYTKRQILAKVGDISQVAGAQLVTSEEGLTRGTRIVRVRTGVGLAFDIAADRAMDISSASWRGVPIGWQTPVGPAAPAFHEKEGLGFLRTFAGGLVTTCGLDFFGAPCEDRGKQLGLHGRISHLPATEVGIQHEWIGDEYLITVRGVVTQYQLFGENLKLVRTVTTTLGANSLVIDDEVVNEGHSSSPHMILYHCNFGWPLVDESAEIVLAERSSVARDAEAQKGYKRRLKIDPPKAAIPEQCYFYDLGKDRQGQTVVGLVNRDFEGGGLAAYLAYEKKELPVLTEWKDMASGDYVIGLEPSNCPARPRGELRKSKELPVLRPGATACYTLELGVVDGKQSIDALVKHIKKLK